MKSIHKLREWVNGLKGAWIDTKDNSLIFTTGDDVPPSMASVNLREHLNGILDDIVLEVEEHYVPLPVDSDGVPIQVGDVMEWCDSGDTLEVIGIGDDTIFYIDRESDRTYAEWTAARNKRHHAPTVEDVLREFAQEMNENLGMYTGEAIDADKWREADERTIAEYAAKLRLAGEE